MMKPLLPGIKNGAIAISIIATLMCSSGAMNAQFHLGTYSFVALGIGGPITENIDFEGKLFANDLITDVDFEVCAMFDLKPGSFHQFSVGGGLNTNFISDDSELRIVFPVELEIYPLSSFRRLSLLIELAPEYFITKDELVLRHLWGVRYYFRDPE